MAQQQPAVVVNQRSLSWIIGHVLLFIGAVLFAVAAVDAGLRWSTPMWAFGFGGFAAWVLGYVFL